MSDELDKIRARRAKKRLEALDSEDEGVRQEVMDTLPWAFRLNKTTGFLEILQNQEMVAITQDPRFAELVTDVLNRMKIAEEMFGDELP